MTVGLGLTTTISYGTLFYTFAVFAPVISKEFGIGLDTFFAIFAAGLFLGGLFAPMVGSRLDRHGARNVMALGSLIAFVALVALSQATGLWTFAIAVIIIELAAAMVFYEAAFAGLTQIHGQKARSHITSVTLIAGFASTIFWPLTQFLVDTIGWRDTSMTFAALHLVVCLPIHWHLLKRRAKATNGGIAEAPLKPEVFHTGIVRRNAIIMYGFSICVSGMVFATFPVHLLIILQDEGLSAQAAAMTAMILGPSQVLARIIEMSSGGRHSTLTTGRICLLMLPVSILLLLAPMGTVSSAILFAVAYGVSQGLSNIVRGSVPLELFGSSGYATLVGRITGVRFVLNAMAPFLFAVLLTRFGMDTALGTCFVLALVSLLAFWQLRPPQEQAEPLQSKA